ncbi:MAG: glycosyltransferase family 39 protein [Candidatus Eisenbacteria bacterium]
MQGKKLSLFVVAIWVILVWVLFIVHQQKPFVQEGHTTDLVGSLLAVLAVFLVSTSLGLRVLGTERGTNGILPACALGLALLGMGTMVLGALGAIRPYAVWIMLAALAGASYQQIALILRRLPSASIRDLSMPETAVTVVMILALIICLINCLAPLTANDALVYHLKIPKIYASSGGFVRLPHNVYANMPHNGEMLYTLVYSVAGETGARLCYMFLIIAAVGAVYGLARRFMERGPALFAASIFLVQPLILDHRTVCNIDVVLAYFYVSAAAVAFDMWKRRMSMRRLVALGVLAGFMLGMKYTAMAPCITLIIILLAARPKRAGVKTMTAGILIALIVFVPWMIKNESYIGNPVYPLLETTFDGQNWDKVQASQLTAWQHGMGMGRGVTDYLLLPLNISTRGKPGLNYTRFDGTMTPLLLILVPLALLGRRRRTSVLITMAAVGFVFWAVTSQQLRFLIPSIAVLAVLAGAGLSNLSGRVGRRAFSVVLVSVILIEISTLFVSDQYRRPFLSGVFADRLPVVMGLETRKSFLERSVQSFGMCDHINRTLPRHERVFMIWENRGYYLERPYFADSFFEASALMRIVSASGDAETLKQRIRGSGHNYVVVNHLLGDVFSRGYPPEDVAILDDLIANHLKPIHTTNRLTLYTIE